MGADGESETRSNSPGLRQALAFLLVAMVVGIPGLLLGGAIVGYLAFVLFGFLFVVFFSSHRRRLFVVLYLFLAVGFLLGGLTHARLNSPETLAQLSTLPLIGSLLGRTTVRLALAVLVGVAGAALIVGSSLWLIIFVSAEWMLGLRETYGLDRKLAMRLLLYLALGTGKATVVVDEGEVKTTKPKGPLEKFGAPAAIVVKPYNAVVLVRGSEVSRIEGAGLYKLQKEEEIKAVIDLRTQGRDFKLEALTEDNMPVKVEGSVSFRIEPASDARRQRSGEDHATNRFSGVISGPYPVYRRTLYQAAFGVSADKDWQSQTQGNAGGQVAGAIRSFRLDEIFGVDVGEGVEVEKTALQEITDKAKEGAVKAARNWGVRVGGLAIVSVQMPEEAQEAFLKRWTEPWQAWEELREAELKADAKMILARAQAEAAHLQEVSKAEALAERYQKVMSAVIEQILDIQDKDIRVQSVLELIRGLQPAVDRGMYNWLLEGRRLHILPPGPTVDKSEASETEE